MLFASDSRPVRLSLGSLKLYSMLIKAVFIKNLYKNYSPRAQVNPEMGVLNRTSRI